MNSDPYLHIPFALIFLSLSLFSMCSSISINLSVILSERLNFLSQLPLSLCLSFDKMCLSSSEVLAKQVFNQSLRKLMNHFDSDINTDFLL